MNGLQVVARLLVLTIVLNIVRYAAAPLIEGPLLTRLFAVMEAYPQHFRTAFDQVDLITSYLYNFGVWFAAVVVFHFMHRSVRGGWLRRSVAVWAVMWLSFASVSAVYMNHYSHSRSFYGWVVGHALLMHLLLAGANAVLYPRIVARTAAPMPSLSAPPD